MCGCVCVWGGAHCTSALGDKLQSSDSFGIHEVQESVNTNRSLSRQREREARGDDEPIQTTVAHILTERTGRGA